MKQATPTKAETTLLEPFVGLTLEQIYVPTTQAQFADAADEITAAGIAGFDTESKPTFAKGDVSAGPHTVQFALHHKAFIFQLIHAECYPFLSTLLSSEAVLKVGFGLSSDREQIQRKLGVTLRAVLDLNTTFRQEGYRHTAGVRAAVAIVLNQKFHKSKRVTTSNWAIPRLTPQQLLYAANDAYAALCVQQALARSQVNAATPIPTAPASQA
jgi:ribonuclease D